MSETHLAERLMYPLPDGWQRDPEQVSAIKKIWPKVIAKNKEMIDAEISRLQSRVEELEKALKPFADKANELEEYAAQGDEKPSDYTAGASYEECRAARTTLEASDLNGDGT